MAPFHPGLAALTKRILKVKDVRLMPPALQLLEDPVLAPAAARDAVAFEESRPAYQAQHHAALFAGLELKALLSDAFEALENQPADTAVLPRSFSEFIWQMQEGYAAAAAAAAAGTPLPEPTAAQCGLPEGWSVELVELALASTAARNGHSPCTFNHTHLEKAEQELYVLQDRLQHKAAACCSGISGGSSSGSNQGATADNTGAQQPEVAGSSSKVSDSLLLSNFKLNHNSGSNSGSNGSKAPEQAPVSSSSLAAPSTPSAAVIAASRFWCADLEAQLFAAADSGAAAAAAAAVAASTPVCPAGWVAAEKAPAADVNRSVPPAASSAAPPPAAAVSSNPRPLTPPPAVTAPYCWRPGTWHAADLEAAWHL